jgi:hypothetical protein
LRVLGLDPSLTNYGWALHDTSHPEGDERRCVDRGRFQTSAKMLFVLRYTSMRESLRRILDETQPDKVGLESPVFNDLFSEGMYGLFLFTLEALWDSRIDVVLWSPLQVKAHARESLLRPSKWKMDKTDMVQAAKKDAGGKVWNHNEADAYLVGRLGARFWQYLSGEIHGEDLTPVEAKYFAEVHEYTRGKKAGQVAKRGVIYREDDRFFQWSQHGTTEG